MQTLAKLAFLQVADEAIDARNGFGRRGRGGEPEIVFDAGGTRLLADRRDKTLAARGIETVGGGLFVEQLLEPDEVLRQCARGKRR
jgi:hypothetical protein